nr:immunoglobulin light chain junction region [Macaca mulatta]MOV77721.1 immunoglobulin light chain junction region [Macaca mulatta]MOV79013.1 immunoglobulin light chain junction region [Macaca mulatta]MOV80918.1 immunoglobulin light chain junction region [Macaca mulatta]MOV81285.1 immunoglobulin light chain junction region [Macaca mulatta]
CQQYTSFPLTF